MGIILLKLASAAALLLGAAVSVLWLCQAWWWRQIRRNGFAGPSPRFPLGNLEEMWRCSPPPIAGSSGGVSHDIHSFVTPYFSRWTEAYGKIFIYWAGTEPFLYIADPEFLKQVTSGATGKKWGKPNVYKHDRKPLFGMGLVMIDGEDWSYRRRIISPAFSPTSLNAMVSVMEETTREMLGKWREQVAHGRLEIDVHKWMTHNAAEIFTKTSFGISEEKDKMLLEKQQLIQKLLFQSNRPLGVPLSNILSARTSYEVWKLGKEIDELLLATISRRKNEMAAGKEPQQQDLLGFLLAAGNGQDNAPQERKLTTQELLDECKTFFFGGQETTSLTLSWTMLLLALHPEWQTALREEVREVTGGQPLDAAMLSKLTKMGWVQNEVLRLYPPAPNVLRQAREDVPAGAAGKVIPKGTNMWVDVVAMHHDPSLWGDDAHEFRPERFRKELHGGCLHRMGFLPFGFGGRICIARNLSAMEFKVVLSLVLRDFSLSLSPSYAHAPQIMLSLRPSRGVHLILHKI